MSHSIREDMYNMLHFITIPVTAEEHTVHMAVVKPFLIWGRVCIKLWSKRSYLHISSINGESINIIGQLWSNLSLLLLNIVIIFSVVLMDVILN